jgi:biofilm PGA synthesis N-glycosyltransferase PgaC
MAGLETLILYPVLFIALFFEVFLLITYLEVREELALENKYLGKDVKNFPTTTIIVPCFNEQNTIAGTVESLLALDYPEDRLSIVLVNDGSTDGTAKVFEQYAHHPRISVFTKENGGKHSALNYALEHVKTDLVGCLDADSFVNPDALKKIVPYFEDADIMAVTPSIKIHDPKTILQRAQRIEYSWGIFLRRMLSSMGALYVTPGPFSIFRTRVFNELGGYRHAHHTEDMEMAMRLQKNRYKIVNSQGAHVYTVAPAKFSKLYTQRVRWTYGFLNNVIDYRDMFFKKKYGNIGMFIMPIATLSIFTTLFTVGTALKSIVTRLLNSVVKFQTVGFQWKFPTLSFDWFFLNTGVVPMLTLTAVMLTVLILLISIQIADGKARFKKELVYYLVIYIFIVPIWLTKALWSTVTRRQISWR